MANELPGLIFHINEKVLSPPAGADHVGIGQVTMTATVYDLAVWDDVITKLDGMEVHTKSTITATLIDVARRRADQAEQNLAVASEEARLEIDRLKAELSFLQPALASSNYQVNTLSSELFSLNEYVASLGLHK
jgi:hypothetical protein